MVDGRPYEELMCGFGLDSYTTSLIPTVSKSHRPLIKVAHSDGRTVDPTVKHKHSPGRAYGKLSINQPKEKLKEAPLNVCVQP